MPLELELAYLKEQYVKRGAVVRRDRDSSAVRWQAVADLIAPYRARFTKEEGGRNDAKDAAIYHNAAALALRTLSAGMMSGITSPARIWWRITTPDPELAEWGPVREWLHQVEERQRTAFHRSNVYNALAGGTYYDLGGFGTHVSFIEEDPRTIIRAFPLPLGQYSLASSARGTIDTIYRDDFQLTVVQLIELFGLERVSQRVRNEYDRGNYDQRIDVMHVVEPNYDQLYGRRGPEGMAIRSAWFEKGDSAKGLLLVKGYEEQPFVSPRWGLVQPEDTYGSTCPGLDCVRDVAVLQKLAHRHLQMVDKATAPALQGPDTGRSRVSTMPNEWVPIPAGSNARVEPIVTVDRGQLEEARIGQSEVVDRIRRAFYEDLWMMLINDNRQQRATAREIDERHEEKMLMLGPVLERLNDELLRPLIDRTFSILHRRGMLPPTPKELIDVPLKIEFLSIMHQAQRLLGLSGVERLAAFGMQLAQAKPKVLDKINEDEMMDEVALMLGTKPNLLHTDDEVAKVRKQRDEEAAKQAQMQEAMAAGQAAKDLGAAPLDEENALSALMGGLAPVAGGYTPGQGGA